MLYGENKLSEDFDCLAYSDSDLASFLKLDFLEASSGFSILVMFGTSIAPDEELLLMLKTFLSSAFESLRLIFLWFFELHSNFELFTVSLFEEDSFTNESEEITGNKAVGWANTCVFTFDEEPIQDGVEEDEEDADTDVKDVEHDDAFLKELEFEEFGGESERMLFVFRQDVKVI